MKVRLLETQNPLVIGSPETRSLPVRSWVRDEPVFKPYKLSQLDRTAAYAGSALAAGSALGQISSQQWWRILSPWQIDQIYQRCPDVRAAIDGIVRRVATHDWEIGPKINSDDPNYDAAVKACDPIRAWMEHPTVNDDTFQEVMTAFLTDLLKHDVGAMERVYNRKGELVESAPIRGPDVYPISDATGRITEYQQVPFNPANPSSTGTPVVKLDPDQILYMNLFPTTMGPGGQPLLEALIHEVIAVLRAAEYWAHSVDMNELPPGILVVVGVAHEAQDRLQAQFEQQAAADWKIRMLMSTDPGQVDAKWVELRKAPRELQLAELADELRRAIWRVFGVSPVEMGDPGGTNRATAEVQVDVSGSHLIRPILELVAAKLNSHIVAKLVPPQFEDMVEFRWVEHKELSLPDRLARAQELTTLLNAGIITRDEARETLGFGPLPGEIGDEITVMSGGVVVRLEDALYTLLPDGSLPGGNANDAGSPKGPRAPKKPADAAEDAVAASRATRGYGTRRSRSWVSSAMPDGWESVHGRTLDLHTIWDAMVAYRNDVNDLWDGALMGAMDAAAAEPALDPDSRTRILAAVQSELTGLAAAWSLAAQPRYRLVAESARRSVGNWTGWSSGADDVRAMADAYHLKAMGHLTADDGPLAAVRREIEQSLVAEDRAIGQRALLNGIAKAFDSARHRIWNWVTRLMDLANQVMVDQLLRAPREGDVPFVEWIDLGGPEECEDCRQYGSMGWIALSDLPTVPGGGQTKCHANCRCVLAVVWQSEIESGDAKLTGAGNQP